MKKNTISTNFDPNECVNLDQSMKIGPHKNKAIHSILCPMNKASDYTGIYLAFYLHVFDQLEI